MKIKVCGITSLDDAHLAIQEGAFALGFIFVSDSPRCIRVEEARKIIARLPLNIMKVGVFVNERTSVVNKIIQQTGITTIQLHGDESPADIQDYTIPVWKAFRVSKGFDSTRLSQFQVSAYLLDTYQEDRHGGTGETFNWKHAGAAKQYGPVVLSGGITPENALKAIESVHPYALDVNSGVESSPGKKDPEKLKRLFRAVKSTITEGWAWDADTDECRCDKKSDSPRERED
ncbi:MAG: phosphoribosylanthranilate isomerase [bacterium]